ncbi:MAG: DUF937 domain-containing protein [Gemmatimonadota bacterium]|nr:DUF937 domain-containing protein [Gemmatimonadota bacterium]
MSLNLEALLGQLTGEQLDTLSGSLGSDRGQTQAAVAAAMPLLFEGLARNASNADGAASLHGALAKDHDGSILDNLGGFLRKPDTADGDGILKHILGDRRTAIESGVSSSSGLDLSKVGPLLSTLAPILLGALGRKQRADSLDTGGLSDLLGRERQGLQKRAPELAGLAGLLDRDGDGQVADDLAGLGGGLLGKLLGGR